MKIRAFQNEDKDSVIQLWRRCGLVVEHNDPEKDIQRKLKVDPEWFLVGEEEGKIIGSCMIGYEGHRGWINYLAVDPAYRKKGYGREMMDRAESLLKEVGCAKINLQLRKNNRSVMEFYESLGFKVDEVISMGKRLEADGPGKIEQADGVDRDR